MTCSTRPVRGFPVIALPTGEAPQAKFETDRTSSHWYDDQSKQSEEAKKGGN